MGNTVSLQKEPEDQESVRGTAYSQVSSEPPANLQNGSVTIQPKETFPSANGDAVDASVSVAQDNVAVSSQKTMEISSVSQTSGNNPGKEAKTAPPAAKSRFVFAFSRPVPGRTEEQATNASAESAQLDVSSEAPQANKASSENVDLPAAAAPEGASDKNLNDTSLSEIELTAPAEAEDSTVPKQKELTFFDRLFRLEKGKGKTKTEDQSQEERKAEDPGVLITVKESPGLQSTPDYDLQGKDVIDECNQNTLPQNSAAVDCLASEDLPQEEEKPESVRTTAGIDYNNAVMSFFKTLVSPSKADSKAESEDKAKKETQEVANTKATEQTVATTTVKSETNIPPSQESPGAKQNPKAPEPPVPPPATATVVVTNEAPKEVTKERSSSTPTPLSKFFWKKTPTDDIEVINTERIEASPEVPAKDETRSQEATETKSKGDEKPSKTNLRKFFKLSVRSEAGVTTPEEVNEQTPVHQTLDFKDKPSTQAENFETGSKKSQESSSEKPSKQQQESKQKTQGPQEETREQEAAGTESLQNGGEGAKENTPKRIEKRQSFGGFFKGLGPKRMSDAEVQTDPVTIAPVVKPK